ncbi:chaperone protein DnaJ [Gordonia hirsuta DSM 44140 = NBRC 16056]|uniref:Chaperone protein DnaJ n=1 Tax=Gordonia hirsuta DSM 44140 = NBRC 16056 TaxID=1121927 RepID=L7LAW5_9ACTN|nr:molecular chaperone DnaJ [Gordonia hirsuta]GAC57173.1 chaperone protein DnaJ [Gordonia hirsuta DSM 44140 = NBRC 16056]
MARDYYGILGVARGASDQDIKRAYRRLARELHPDVNPTQEDRFKEITTAYEVLSDPNKRRIVDAGGDPLAGPGGMGGFGGGDFGGLGDIFNTFFGGGGGGFGGRGPRGRVRPGERGYAKVTLDLDEIAAGAEREITINTAVLCEICDGDGTRGDSTPTSCPTCKGHGEIQTVQRSILGNVMSVRECPECRGAGEVITDPCLNCGGDGRVRAQRSLTVQIPAGVEHGMNVRLAGQGEVGPGGGPAGDLFVEIHERPNDVFVRDKDDLHCTVRVPMTDAALGAQIEIDTVLDSTATVHIDPGTQPGEVITVKGKGLPHLNTGLRGHLHAHLEVVVPAKLDSTQSDLLRRLKESGNDEVELVTASSKGDAKKGVFSKLRNVFAGR